MDGYLGKVKDEGFVKDKLSSFVPQGKMQAISKPKDKPQKKLTIDSRYNEDFLQ